MLDASTGKPNISKKAISFAKEMEALISIRASIL
jgi:hypothetical protein